MSKLLLPIATFLILLGCRQSNELQYTDFEHFRIKLPKNYNISTLNSPDSYAAVIEFSSGALTFDYGPYASKLTRSPDEYLKERLWEQEDKFLMSHVIDPLPEFEHLRDSGGHFYATYNIAEHLKSEEPSLSPLTNEIEYSFKDSLMTYYFQLPEKIGESEFNITESDSLYKRVFVAFEQNKHSSGVYLLNKNSCTNELNCREQLSIWTSDEMNIDRERLMEILNSAEFISAR